MNQLTDLSSWGRQWWLFHSFLFVLSLVELCSLPFAALLLVFILSTGQLNLCHDVMVLYWAKCPRCVLIILPAVDFTATILPPYLKGPSITTPCCEPCKVKLSVPFSHHGPCSVCLPVSTHTVAADRVRLQEMNVQKMVPFLHSKWFWFELFPLCSRCPPRHLYDNPLSFVGTSAFQNLSDLHSL